MPARAARCPEAWSGLGCFPCRLLCFAISLQAIMPHRGTALTPGPFNLKFKFSEDALPFRIAGMCFTGNNYGQGRIRQPEGSELEPRDRTPGRRGVTGTGGVVPGQGATAARRHRRLRQRLLQGWPRPGPRRRVIAASALATTVTSSVHVQVVTQCAPRLGTLSRMRLLRFP